MNKYTVRVETIGQATGDVMTCNACGDKAMGTDRMDAFFLGARHQRERHNG